MSYGRIVSAPLIERGIEGTLRALLGPYIGEVCAQLGYARLMLPDPEHVQRLERPEDLREGEQVAALVIATPETMGDAVREPDGWTVTWDVACAIVCDLGDPLKTREAAQMYAAAIGTCLDQQGCAEVAPDSSDAVVDSDGQLVTLAGSQTWFLGEQYTPVRQRPDLIMGGAAVRVRVERARPLYGGPDIVPEVGDDGHVVREPLEDGEPTDIVPNVTVDRL